MKEQGVNSIRFACHKNSDQTGYPFVVRITQCNIKNDIESGYLLKI